MTVVCSQSYFYSARPACAVCVNWQRITLVVAMAHCYHLNLVARASSVGRAHARKTIPARTHTHQTTRHPNPPEE